METYDLPAATTGWRPRVSIVTPSFNQAPFLERTIRSVLEQDYPDVEYLVLDGGSTDGSLDLIRTYADRLSYWSSGPDGGQSSAINDGWQRATGQVLAWLNSDDFYLPGAVSAAIAALQEHPASPFAYGTCEFVDPTGRAFARVGSAFDRRALRRGHQMAPQPATFFRRAAIERVGPLDESLHYSMDYELFWRLAEIGDPVFIDRPLAGFTVHTDAKTIRHRRRARLETLRVAEQRAHGVDRLVVRLLAVRARLYHALPGALRHRLDAARGLPQPRD